MFNHPEVAVYVMDVEAEVSRLKTRLVEAMSLLREVRTDWIRVGYGASHEDVAECRDVCSRIDAFIEEQRKS